jgi:hypothetical protein
MAYRAKPFHPIGLLLLKVIDSTVKLDVVTMA